MDFRTEWSSWLLVLFMIAITVYISPYAYPSGEGAGAVGLYILQILGFPFLLITVACIPVLLVCWLIKVIPDIDYSIRVAFGIILILLIGTLMG